jgi:hypothetical protein
VARAVFASKYKKKAERRLVLRLDNRYGRMVFGASRVGFTRPVLSRITYQAFTTECKERGERSRPLSAVLWKIASGTADYREVLRDMCSYGVLRSVFGGAAVTLRNVAVEALLGLKWGEYGRYPTVGYCFVSTLGILPSFEPQNSRRSPRSIPSFRNSA